MLRKSLFPLTLMALAGLLAVTALATASAGGDTDGSESDSWRAERLFQKKGVGGRAPTAEDNGSLPLAEFVAPIKHGPIGFRSTIGDGPHGSAGSGSGDFDWWEIQDVNGGWIITVDLEADDAGSTLDPMVAIYDSAGSLLAENDDDSSCCSVDSFLEFTLPADGTYYVVVGGFGTGWQTDPFDSGSGQGAGDEGDYLATVALHAVHP